MKSRKYSLEIVVFLCGAVVMVFEIAGSRVLGPYLGTSIFIWTSLIGIILGSLSLGYWLGGKFSDKRPSITILARIILLSALAIGLMTLIKDIVLDHLPSLVNGLKAQCVIAALVLFAPASILLGMVSPYAVRLKISNVQTSGATVGNLYAISTIGSIAGTFAAGFVLIPRFGTTNILLYMTILLAGLSFILFLIFGKKNQGIPPAACVLIFIYIAIAFNYKTQAFLDIDTKYNRVWIYDAKDPLSGRMVKFMRINNESSSAIFLDGDGLVFPYAHYYSLAEYFNPGFQSALLLGGAGYTYPDYFIKKYPDATIDVVEIDPELTQLAKEYFGLTDNPRMQIFHEDGRTYINHTKKKYDVLYGDAYKSLYTIPWHLATLEAIQRTYDLLNDNGVVLVNIISSLGGPSSEFLRAEFATFRSVFPIVRIFAVNDNSDENIIQSVILVAVKSRVLPNYSLAGPEYRDLLANDVTAKVRPDMPVLTDDYAPVDYYTNKAIR
jgi:predicted membrane-bound spermidine synthase